MKADLILSQDIIDSIANRVVELLKPILLGKEIHETRDTVFDVRTLAGYLRVKESWVYKQVSLKTIPYFKSGKYTRFRKKEIDRWIDSRNVPPSALIGMTKKVRAVS